MRLVLVELDRFRSRRAVALVLLATVLLGALLAATAIWDTRPATDRELTRAQAQLEAAQADPVLERDVAECQEQPSDFFGPDATDADCERLLTPRLEDFLPRNQLDLGLVADHRAIALVALVTALLIVAGATFAGADWASGSISNQLLFQPRRAAVWLAKAVAVLAGAAVTAAVVLAGFWVALAVTADARGIPVPEAAVTDIWWTSARGVALAAFAAVGAFALTMLLRSTVGTLAVLFAYAVAGEALILALPIAHPGDWSLANNVFAWIEGGTKVFDLEVTCRPGLESCESAYVLGMWQGAAYLLVLLLLAAVVSVLSFRRRDVP